MPETINGDVPVTIAGWFWLPGKRDEEKIAGQLALSKNRIELRLVGALIPIFKTTRIEGPDGIVVKQEPSGLDIDADHFVVHGNLMDSQGRITLVDCMTINRRQVGNDELIEEQHVRAMYAFRGAHLSGPNENFRGLRVRLHNLENWASIGDPTYSINRQDHGMTVCLHPRKFEAARLSDGSTVNVCSDVSAPRGKAFYGRSLECKVMYEVLNIPGLGWRELDRQFVTPLVSLTTMCVADYCPPIEQRVLTRDGDWVEVIYGANEVATAGQPAHKMLLPLSELTLVHVATWLNRVEKLGPLPPVVAKSFTASSISLETDLLNLTTIAEGLHERIFPESVRMSKFEASRLRELITEAIRNESERYKRTIRDATGHLTQSSYKERLMDLLCDAARGMPNIVGNAEQWARKVRDSRNDYAHRTAGFLEKEDIDKYYGVALSLRWVLVGVLLLQAGIAPEILAARLRQDSSYQFSLVQLQRYLPDAYPPPESAVG